MNDGQSPLIKFASGKSGYYRAEEGGKPTNAPTGNKNFKKILRNEGDGSDKEDYDAIAEASEESGAVAMEESIASPFALVSKKLKKPIKMSKDTSDVAEEHSVESPSDLIASLGKAKKAPLPQGNSPVAQEDKPETDNELIAEIPIEKTNSKPNLYEKNSKNTFASTEDTHTHFNREQPDLAYVNPLGLPQTHTLTTTEVQAKNVVMPVKNLQELIDKLVSQMSVMTNNGDTETTVVLSQPPQFDGVRIVITNSETARNDFNLKFENLTQAAQGILDQQQNRADLLAGLERKGYNVQIIVTTTYVETNPIASVEEPNREQGRDQDKEGQQKGKEKEREGFYT